MFSKKIASSILPALLGLAFSGGLFGQKTLTTPNGFRLVLHSENPGPKTQAGDMVRLHMTVCMGDTVLMSSYGHGDPQPVPIPAKEMVQQASPILDALDMMAAGDSATVFQPIDSLTRIYLPASRAKEKELRFELKLLGIVTQAEQEAAAAKAQALLAEIAAKTNATIADFNAAKIGTRLISLPSGLQMLIHEVGTGAEVEAGQSLRVHYYGALTNNTMFDNSFERGEPIEFVQGAGQMIPGFDEGAGMLRHGGKATLFIPPALGYGEEGTPDGTIPPKSTLVFYIEVE